MTLPCPGLGAFDARPGAYGYVWPVWPTGTTVHNPVTLEWGRVAVSPEDSGGAFLRAEMLAQPTGHPAGPHFHPHQEEHFEVVSGELHYRLGDTTGTIGPGQEVTVPAGVHHDWWNEGDEVCHAFVTVTPPGQLPGDDRRRVGAGRAGPHERLRRPEAAGRHPAGGGLLGRRGVPEAAAGGAEGLGARRGAAGPGHRAIGHQRRGSAGSARRPGKLASQPVRRPIWDHRRREGGDRRRGVQRNRHGHGAAARRHRRLHDLRARRRPRRRVAGQPLPGLRPATCLPTSTRTRTSSGRTGRARARPGRRSWTTCTRRPTGTGCRAQIRTGTEIASADFDGARAAGACGRRRARTTRPRRWWWPAAS